MNTIVFRRQWLVLAALPLFATLSANAGLLDNVKASKAAIDKAANEPVKVAIGSGNLIEHREDILKVVAAFKKKIGSDPLMVYGVRFDWSNQVTLTYQSRFNPEKLETLTFTRNEIQGKPAAFKLIGKDVKVADTRQHHSAVVFALASRFPGFEVDDCGGTILFGQEAIKGVNWLTVLGDKFVPRVGGVPALREKLSEAIEIHTIPGRGVLLRAGKQPRTGDVNRGDRLPLYGEDARTLAPIRMVQHPALGPIELGSFGPRGTAAWLKRFEVP